MKRYRTSELRPKNDASEHHIIIVRLNFMVLGYKFSIIGLDISVFDGPEFVKMYTMCQL